MHRSPTKGFTLPEILMVLAIFAVLSAILFTVVGRVKESGHRTVCQLNTSQIFKAVQMYMQGYDSRFPSYDAWPVLLEPYVKSGKIFHCPSVNAHSVDHPDIDYVALPERVSHLTIDSKGRFKHLSANEAGITSTSDWVLMMDYGSNYQSDRMQLVYPEDCSVELAGQKFLARDFPTNHTGGGNYLFADGHMKWMLPTTAMKTDCAAGPFLR